MATRNFVPRADNEGSIGTYEKKWANVYATDGNIAGRNIRADGSTLETHGTIINDLNTKVSALERAYGGPLVAHTAAEMTDITKVYVYTGNEEGYQSGYWYYYDGSEWQTGGIYNALAFEIDTTLSQAGYAADSLAAGKAITKVQVNIEKEIARVGEYLFKNQYGDYNLPVIYLYGDADKLIDKSVTLTNVTCIFPKYGIDTTLSKIKVQGNSSAVYPKKNFTLTFPDKFEAVNGWGKQKKYVIKSNFTDISQVRNLGSARLWRAIRYSRITSQDIPTDENDNVIVDTENNGIRVESNPMLSTGINGGAVDGYPCMVVINNEYWGLYNFNVPKDGWMARMGGGDKDCIVSADKSLTQAQVFKGLPTMEISDNGLQDFEIEYLSNEDDDTWVLPSLTRMIQAVIDSTGANYRTTCQDYIDINSAIDYFIFCVMTGNMDGIDKNYLLDTFDGVKWYFNAYDMDNVFGLFNVQNTKFYYEPNRYTFAGLQNSHRMFHLIYGYDKQALCDRYEKLRGEVLSESYVTYLLYDLAINIPKPAMDYEPIRWSAERATHTNTIEQILNWYRLQCMARDKEIEEIRDSI